MNYGNVITVVLTDEDQLKYGLKRMSLNINTVDTASVDLKTRDGRYKAVKFFSIIDYNLENFGDIYGNEYIIHNIRNELRIFSKKHDLSTKENRVQLYELLAYVVRNVIHGSTHISTAVVLRNKTRKYTLLFNYPDSFLIQIKFNNHIAGVFVYQNQAYYVPAWVVTKRECLEFVQKK